MSEQPAKAGVFRRYLLPALALKGVIIGGGYSTGRELIEYFLTMGPVGAMLAMAVAAAMWSLIAAMTFALAHHFRSYDYRAFIERLLGRAAVIFEICFLLFSILLLAVFGAAAGELGVSLFRLPALVGTVALAVCIAIIAGLGENAVEAMFKYVSMLLYTVYAAFLVLALTSFGDRISASFAAGGIEPGWALSGVTYGAYNIVAAVMILPVLQHQTSRRQAFVAGAIAGPMAMLPALFFLIAMVGFYPQILTETLPSDYLLQRMGSPAFRFVFQLMVFGALLESGVGVIHALNERALAFRAARKGKGPAPRWFRPALTLAILAGCMFVASRIGLVDLIASGYRLMAYVFLATFVLPLMTVGVYRLFRSSAQSHKTSEQPA